jgi:hypothetical protein
MARSGSNFLTPVHDCIHYDLINSVKNYSIYWESDCNNK